jgi:DNA-3-methyladenine glycosylase II
MNNSSILVLSRDRHFAELIKKYGVLRREKRKNPFQSLIRSIVYQQVSGRAAASILNRFLGLFDAKEFPTPEEVLKTPIKKLRSAGLSFQKVSYIRDLAGKFSDGTIKYKSFSRMSNEEIIEHLIRVKGIGVWTAHMFLMSTMGRPDILPTGDLGIRKGFQVVYSLKSLPDHAKMERLAKPWREHATCASWYLWQVANEAKRKNK